MVTAAFWRTFHHEGKISLVRVGGARPPPFTAFTLTSKVAVYAPAEWADTLTLFHLYQYKYSVGQTRDTSYSRSAIAFFSRCPGGEGTTEYTKLRYPEQGWRVH